MYDIVIANGLIVDGTGGKPYHGAVCIQGDTIAKIVRYDEWQIPEGTPAAIPDAKQVCDACGHVIAPGFIDIHTHSDYSHLSDPRRRSCVGSGLTLEVVGNCGKSSIPVADPNSENLYALSNLIARGVSRNDFHAYDVTSYGENISVKGSAINIATLIGHGNLRNMIAGFEMRQLTPGELQRMCDLCDDMLTQGAMGVSLGLIYVPGNFCNTAELIALARVVARHGKVMCVHMRNENDRVFEAVDEVISISRETGCRMEISHFKLMGTRQWGKARELLARIDRAKAQGVRVTCDQYPYTFSMSGIAACFPTWAQDGGNPALAARVADDVTWERILPEAMKIIDSRGGIGNITICNTGRVNYPEMIGKTWPELAAEQGLPVMDALRAAVIKCNGTMMCFYKNMSDEDVLTIMSRPDVSVISDGTGYNIDCFTGAPHPRNVGTFPRFFRMVRENNLMPIETAVTKVTSLPASVMMLDDRFGFIKEGCAASVTVFDKDTISDQATMQDGTLASKGIDYVIVNGSVVFDHGTHSDALPGKLVKR
ncbi:MAG: D-aminoacylase [Lachnospiraceae bacterium]|nr:D-aminoacylase [Lachnospiraceae bacterium]